MVPWCRLFGIITELGVVGEGTSGGGVGGGDSKGTYWFVGESKGVGGPV